MRVLMKFVEDLLLKLQSVEGTVEELERHHMRDIVFCIFGQVSYRCKDCAPKQKSWADLEAAARRAFPHRDLGAVPFPSFLGSSAVIFKER